MLLAKTFEARLSRRDLECFAQTPKAMKFRQNGFLPGTENTKRYKLTESLQ